MLTTAVVASAKKRLDLSDTSFDTELTDFVTTSLTRFYPKIMKEIDPQQATPSVDSYGEATIDLAGLTTPLDDVRDVEASQGGAWGSCDKYHRHGTKLRVRDLDTSTTRLNIYGLKIYVISGASTDLPDIWLLPLVWYVMSEFYDMLAASKSKFNIYMQTNGGNAVDDMRAEADYYEKKASDYVDEKASLYGS